MLKVNVPALLANPIVVPRHKLLLLGVAHGTVAKAVPAIEKEPLVVSIAFKTAPRLIPELIWRRLVRLTGSEHAEQRRRTRRLGASVPW
jgi:hypothetical protein